MPTPLSWNDQRTDLVWNAEGDVHFIDGSNVEKQDRELSRLWSQNGWLKINDPQTGEPYRYVDGIAMLSEERVAVSVSGENSAESGRSIYVLDFRGNFSDRSLFVRVLPSIFHQGPNGIAMTAATHSGDLDLAYVSDDLETIGRVRILREHYTALGPTGTSAVDPAGNFYSVTRFGGRTSEDQHWIVCRLPVDGGASCVEIARDIEAKWHTELVALPDGVLILQVDSQLLRIEYPEDSA